MIIYSVMVVLVLDGGRGGELYVDPPGIVVEDEEIGKMGRWPIRRCELILQFNRALAENFPTLETAMVINNELHPKLCDILRQQEMQRGQISASKLERESSLMSSLLGYSVSPRCRLRATSSSMVLVIWFR